jgi:ATP-binding cassette, subfamily B, bacterial
LIFAIPVAVIKWYSGYALHRLEKRQVAKEREANYLHSILTTESYALEVRTLNFGRPLIQKFNKIRSSIFSEKTKLNRRLTAFSAIAESAEVLVFLFILFKLSQGALNGTFSWGLLVVYVQGIQKLQGNLKGFLNSAVSLIQQRIFLADLFKFLDIPILQNSQESFALSHDGFNLQVNQVSFLYPGSKNLALDRVSMVFPKGKVIGIVGANGSGKSTLVKLLAGMYHPTDGEITVHGVSLSQCNQTWWRDQTLFLFQDFQKYFFSIQEIIALGPENTIPDAEKTQKALRDAEAWEFVSQFDKGIKAKLGRVFLDGKGLSGGQWQKLAISRAFYRNPRILVLDEPTSGIDAMAETHIFRKIRENSKDRVTILITHRLYNLKDADYVYVLDQGKVVQEGSFEDLSFCEGIFSQLYSNQKFG